MNNRQTGTNAADSAPGVNDGPTAHRRPEHATKPGGRGKVWLWVLLSLAVLLAVFIATPKTNRSGGGDDPAASMGASQAEIESSTVPGAANSGGATAPPRP